MDESGFHFNLQNYIYSMNEPSIRNSIMRKYISSEKDYKWYGTVFLNDKMSDEKMNQKLNESFKKMNTSCIILMTYAYSYEHNKIHYIATIFDMKKKKLVIFDPGYNIYKVGSKVLVPCIKKFYTSFSHRLMIFEKNACDGNRFGIQRRRYINGIMNLDAFCQSWTLFFLHTYIERNQDLSFFEDWCRIHPKYRELFLFQNFIIPSIQTHKVLRTKYKDLSLFLEKILMETIWT